MSAERLLSISAALLLIGGSILIAASVIRRRERRGDGGIRAWVNEHPRLMVAASLLAFMGVGTVAFRSAIPFGTASSWSSAVNADPNAVRGPWYNTNEVALVHTNTGGSGTDWQLDQIQYSVKAFGAIGNGVADDTAAINATCAAAGTAVVFFPAGNYVYTGNGGCTGLAMKFQGIGKDQSVITLSAGNFFIDDNQAWQSLQVRGIRFEGGAGAIRNRYTGTDVLDYKEVDDCFFNGYTGAAISSNASDDPYWKISRSIFKGANSTTTMGVALSGYADSDTIEDCEFLRNKIGAKFSRGANNAKITNSAFLQFAGGTQRVDIWVVPETSLTNSGQGFVVNNVKFGAENMDVSDYRVLYADEGPGTYFGDRLWSTSTSTGFIGGHRFQSDYMKSISGAGPFVYSYTNNITGSQYGPLTIGGFEPSYIVQLDTPPTVDVAASNYGNVIGSIEFGDSHLTDGLGGWLASNAPSMFAVVDPQQAYTAADKNVLGPWTVGTNAAGYQEMLTTATSSFFVGGGASIATVADAAGGTNAVEATLPQFGLTFSNLTAAPTAGVPMWIEFDMQAGSSSPLVSAQVRMQEQGTNNLWFKRLVTVSSTWRHYRLLYTPRAIPGGGFEVSFDNPNAGTGTVQIGQVRVYQAYEPTLSGPVLAQTVTGTYTLGGTPTITAVAPVTWDSDNGTIKAATFDRSTAGTVTVGGTATQVDLKTAATVWWSVVNTGNITPSTTDGTLVIGSSTHRVGTLAVRNINSSNGVAAASDATGASVLIATQPGGVASATGGGTGGLLTLSTSTGGAGTAGLAAGKSGNLAIVTGAAGANNGGGGAGSGDVTIDVGAATGAAANGKIQVGLGTNTPTEIDIAKSSGKISFFGVTAVAQQNGTGNTTTVAAGSTTSVFTNTTFSGGVGSTGYTVGDIVKALKNYGALAQ